MENGGTGGASCTLGHPSEDLITDEFPLEKQERPCAYGRRKRGKVAVVFD
ncbi:MAG: hypothetical protein ACLVAW_06430 [Eisenbergiella massiliensis]